MSRTTALLVMGLVLGVVGCGEEKKTITDPQGNTIAVATENYASGKVKIRYQYYVGDSGRTVISGYYREYYESGKIAWEASFKDGARDGHWVWYDEQGLVRREQTWANGTCVSGC